MHSRRMVFSGLVLGCLAFAAVPAAAQPVQEHGYVVGMGGATVAGVDAPMIGASVGVNVTPNLLITGEVGKMMDMQPRFTRDDLQVLTGQVGATGIPFTASAKVPAYFVTAGGRYTLPSTGLVRPYLLGSAGWVHVIPEPSFMAAGINVTDAVLSDATLGRAFRKQDRPLASAGGGMLVAVTDHLAMDFGYKYSRVFINTDYLQLPESPDHHNGINLHRLYAGIGYGF